MNIINQLRKHLAIFTPTLMAALEQSENKMIISGNINKRVKIIDWSDSFTDPAWMWMESQVTYEKKVGWKN